MTAGDAAHADLPGGGLLRAGLARAFLALLGDRPGLSLDALLTTAGLRRADLADADALVSLSRCIALVEHAARTLREPTLGLSFAAAMPWSAFGALGYVVLNSPTVGAAFGNLRRYIAIHQTRGGIEIDAGPRLTRIYRPTDPELNRGTQVSDFSLGLYTRLARDGLGERAWAPRAVHFRRPRPRSVAPYTRWFAAPLHFGQPRDAIVLDSADLRRPFRTADPGLYPILLSHADACLARAPGHGELGGDVRRLVLGALRGGDTTIERAAAALGLGPRSLQRRLRDAGLSFQQLVAEARFDLARRYVADPAISLTEAAFLLGYADLSAFSRAFRRWTGKSPQAFRREAAS